MAAAFDTLKYVETLKAGGFPEHQAKAQAQALIEAFAQSTGQIATKADLLELGNRLREDILELEKRLTDRITRAEAQFTDRINEGEKRSTDRITALEERVTRLEGRVALLQWMVGFNLALTVAVLLLLIRSSL